MVVYTAGFMTHVTCRLTAKNRDQLRNPTLGSRVLATFVKGPHCSHAEMIKEMIKTYYYARFVVYSHEQIFVHTQYANVARFYTCYVARSLCLCTGQTGEPIETPFVGTFLLTQGTLYQMGPDLSSKRTLWGGGIRLVSNPI